MVTKEVLPEGIFYESPDFTTIILILLAFIILVVLIVLFLIFACRHRNNKTKDARREIAERIQLENQGSSLNPTQNAAATQLSGMSGEIGDGRHELETTRQPRRTDCGYTMLSQCTMTQSERVYASLTACESANSNRNRPCNKSPIYVNQGLAFLPGLHNN
ncbi:uncharacterized protein [Porites lutea]|uniref:uncharacterized protein n=1 Tax=Porites lutea TaxID=51062 RepID=UPI003CC579DF